MKKLSIAVPCYEMEGLGKKFLRRLLESVAGQHVDFNDIEIIISDHSENDDLGVVAKEFQLPITYLKNSKGVGYSSANMNNCIRHSSGEYIKPIFQDDFLLGTDSLQIIIDNLDSDWLVHSYNHYKEDSETYYNERTPHYNYRMMLGDNTIGPPTCMAFKNDDNYFDDGLMWFMDVEFYHRLKLKYGDPKILQCSPLATSTIWSGQVTQVRVNDAVVERERQYLDKKRSQSDRKVLELKQHKIAAGDIREHFDTIQRYAMNSDTIVEMGVRSIISTWAFIAGKPQKQISIDITHPSEYAFIPGSSKLEDVERVAKEEGVDFEFILSDSRKVEIPECDLLFIDTLHTYDQLTAELSIHADKAKKWIILHDTVTFATDGESPSSSGIWKAVEEFIDKTEWKIKEHYTNNNGLTVLEK